MQFVLATCWPISGKKVGFPATTIWRYTLERAEGSYESGLQGIIHERKKPQPKPGLSITNPVKTKR